MAAPVEYLPSQSGLSKFPGEYMFANIPAGIRACTLLCLLTMLPPRLLYADTLIMQDGSRLLG